MRDHDLTTNMTPSPDTDPGADRTWIGPTRNTGADDGSGVAVRDEPRDAPQKPAKRRFYEF